MRLLFLGDSITDCGRNFELDCLGTGYVKKINDTLKQAGSKDCVINRGVSGDRARDLKRRLVPDCIDEKPDILTMMIGINDCARRYDSGDETPLRDFEGDCRAVIAGALEALPSLTIIIMEPFLLPLLKEHTEWRQDLDPKIHCVRALAMEYKCGLVPLDGIMAQNAVSFGYERLTYDGVHLLDIGHEIIAGEWIRYVKNQGLLIPICNLSTTI